MKSENLAWLIRRHGIEMTHISGGSHIGAVLSVADIIAVLYSDILKYDPKNPEWDARDRFILSKGHAGASVYAALAECGFFEVNELKTHYQNGSRLSGHVSHHLPGVDFSTGSLGHGLSVATGMSIAAKQDKKSHRVFAVLGDGECNEGSVWEAAQLASHFKLNNLFAVIDNNKMQSLDFCKNTLNSGLLSEKWKAFGWNCLVVNGHDHEELRSAFQNPHESKPTVIIAETVKGKGVSFMETDILWHYRFPHNGWEYDNAVNELHRIKPKDTIDPYTPNGIENPEPIPVMAETRHTMSETYMPQWFDPEV